MKKMYVTIFAVAALAVTGFSQKGNNQINAGVEAGLPTGDFADLSKAGVGVTAKGLYGVGTAGQVTLTTGVESFSYKNEFKDVYGADKITLTGIPILAGYRHHFDGFFVEPQIGYGIYKGKIKGGDFASSSSNGAFTWALGGGYIYNNFEASLRYQSAHSDGGNLSFIGLRFGYNFSLGKNEK